MSEHAAPGGSPDRARSDADSVAAGAPADDTVDGTVDVVVPLRAEFAATLRVVAAALGADAGFTVDEIDDLRLALSEVFSSLAEGAPAGRCRARFHRRDDGLAVTLGWESPGASIVLDDLAATILATVVDEYRSDTAGVTLVKRAGEAVPGAAVER
jgi:serine/threonine-protein kinase RsbW